MKRLFIILAAAWLLGAATSTAGAPAVAAPSGSSATALASQQDRAVYDLLVIDRRLQSSQAGLLRAQTSLAHTVAELDRRAAEAARAGRDLDKIQRRLNERVRASYVRGPFGWLDFLGQSRSLGALLTRADLLSRVLDQEARLTREVKQARSRADTARNRLSSLAKDQKAAVARLRAQRDGLRQAEDDQAALAERLGSRLAAARAAAHAAEARMADLNRKARASSDVAVLSARGGDPLPTIPRTTQPPAPPTEKSAGGASTGRTMLVKSTAYAQTGLTATGVPAGPGIVAVDPRVIPLGTRVSVPGWGEGIAADTGGDIKGAWIDVWLPSQALASDWGIKYITITILD